MKNEYRIVWQAIRSEERHTEYYDNRPALYRRKRELRDKLCRVWLSCRHVDGSWIDV